MPFDITFTLDAGGLFLHATISAIVWAVANIVYVDLRKKGVHGLGRFAAFWMGVPLTWLSLFLVREGTQPEIRPPEDDDAGLLAEIRRDRLGRLDGNGGVEGERVPGGGGADPA